MENKNKSTILITGGAGYIGCQVTRDLLEKYPSYNIVIMDNLSKGRLEKIGSVIAGYENKVDIIPSEQADIRDKESISGALKKYSPKIIIHLAAIVDAFTTNRKGKDVECMEVNYHATMQLGMLAKEHGVQIFINISSVSMYCEGNSLTEESPKKPLSTYGLAKMKSENELQLLQSEEFSVCSLRPATVIGFTQGFRYETIINLCCIRVIYDSQVTIFESALYNKKSYVSVNDLSLAILFSLTNIEKTRGNSYNVATIHTCLADVIEIIENYLGKKMIKEIKKESRINQQVYTINGDKIISEGFTPKQTNLAKIIINTLNKLFEQKRSFELYDTNIQTSTIKN